VLTDAQRKKAAKQQDEFFARLAGNPKKDDATVKTQQSEMDTTAMEEDDLEVDDGTLFTNLPVWRLIPKDQDSRPAWRYAFDCGLVPFEFEFSESSKAEHRFHVKLLWRDLERLVVDDWKILVEKGDFKSKPLHEQRIRYFLDVSSDRIIQFAFDVVCQWFPQGDGVDSAKWAKFCRDMRLFPDIHKPKRAAQVWPS
jgi:hypothetical protein